MGEDSSENAGRGRPEGGDELPDRVATILAAFGPPDGPSMAEAVDLARVEPSAHIDPAAIEAALAGEVDEAQAAMFARRAVQVFELLDGLADAGSAEARVYKVGLTRRLQEVCEALGPRALRVRALADFYHSQAALLHHRGRLSDAAVPRLEALVAEARWRDVAKGVQHARLAGDSDLGPIHVNLLRVRGGRFETLDARERADSLVALAAERGAAAAVSGGFFLYSEPDIAPPSRRSDPVGLLVTGGTVLNPPYFRRAAFLERHDGPAIEVVDLVGATFVWPTGALTVMGHNDPAALKWGAVSFNRAYGLAMDVGEHPSFAVVGNEVVAGAPEIPLAGALIVAPLGTPVPPVGSIIAVDLPGAPRQGVAGGPMLFDETGVRLDLLAEDFDGSAPPVTFSQDETFDQNLLPRMGVGLTADGDVIFAAADGRSFDVAPGMRLRDLARLLRAAGCVRALNLDGGSSKRMVVAGEVVDLPSTEVVAGGGKSDRIRPVHSAILVFPSA